MILNDLGVDSGNSDSSREVITIEDTQTVSNLVVKDDAFYELDGAGSLSGDSLIVGLGGNLSCQYRRQHLYQWCFGGW